MREATFCFWILWFFIGLAQGASLSQDGRGLANQDQNLERDMQELAQLRRPGGSVAVMKTHSVIFKNINGEREQYEQRKEEVQKNGEIIARVQQEMDKSGQNPEPHVRTLLDIPAKNLHRVIEHGPKHNDRLNKNQPSMNATRIRSTAKKPFSPMDMAEYVFWTGDERGATSAIEEFLEDGLMSRDEAITFLEEIKENLESLRIQYANDADRPKLQLVAQRYAFNKQ